MPHPIPARRHDAPLGDERLLAGLTPEQAQAVTHGTGPLLLLAGPGAGKTRTLTHRIAYLLETGRARPGEILAVTFSVRAAGELRLRLADLLGQERARGVMTVTFHSFCARLLREHPHLFGRTDQYTIYDQGDGRRVLEHLLYANSATELQQPRETASQRSIPELSRELACAKNRLLSPAAYRAASDYDAAPLVAALWEASEAELAKSNAFDFDDLLVNGVRLLSEHPRIAERVRSRWQWVLVDEYQDANHAQVALTALLAGRDGNLAAVADDDQCLVAGTRITMADGSRKVIENVEPGDVVLSAHGGGRLGPSRVLRVHGSVQPEGIEIITAEGRRLVSTPDHIHFAGYQYYGTPQMYLTYAMCKGRHFRLGTTSVYTGAKVKPILGLQNRCAGEHADAAWVVSTHATELDARIAELRLSLQYGLPMLPFVARPNRTETGCSIVGDQAALDQVFDSLDTWSAGLRLLSTHGLSLSHPHQHRQGAEGRRRNVTVMLCKDDRAHLLYVGGSDPDIDRALRNAGYSPAHTKPSSPAHWVVRKQSTDLGLLLREAERIRELSGGQIRLVARVGPTSKSSERAILPLMPASAVRPGMVMATEDPGYDTVVSVERVNLASPVFDLDVERTHNFVAEGVITHNCVYSWRGANARNVVEFGRRYPRHETIVLARNFRSRAEILQRAVRCIQHNRRRTQKTLIAMRGTGGRAEVRWFPEDWHEAHWIARHVGEAIAAGFPGPEILILARTGYATQPVQLALARAGIPHRVLGSLGLYERAEVKDALAYLTLLVNPSDAQAFGRAIQSPRRGVGPATANLLITRARAKQEGDLIGGCRQVDQIDGIRGEPVRRRISTFGEQMSAARREMNAGRSLGHVVLQTVMLAGGLVQHFEERRDGSPNRTARRDAERVLEDLRSLCRAAQAFDEQHGSRASLREFLEHAIGLHAQELEAGEDRRVTVSTVHRAKGAEATRVILLGCEEQLLPSWQSIASLDEEAIEEERRVFYVACTRAKDQLMLTHVGVRGGSETSGPSRFLSEAGSAYGTRWAAG